MKRWLTMMGGAIVLAFVGFQLATVYAEDGEYTYRIQKPASKQAAIYADECSACHMAYPPGLLPSGSWEKILGGLSDHFGDNAELDEDAYNQIRAFLIENSADTTGDYRSRRIVNGLNEDLPLRISELPYIRHEHNEIPAKMIRSNPQVTSLSHCNHCHRHAQQGLFNEDDVRIPGYGRWDD